MITDKQKDWLTKLLTGEIKRRDDPRKYSTYKRRIRKTIDHNMANLLWVAENCPEILRDREWELSNNVPDKRRAKALLKAVALFQTEAFFGEEATIIKLLQEMYPAFRIELVKRKAPRKVVGKTVTEKELLELLKKERE